VDALRERAHALKGAAATLGANRLAAACKELEEAGRDGDLERARGLIPELLDATSATEAGLAGALQTGLQPSRR
jgi:HPt (histidine-containing phosphotransfer) domain-containing protein